MIRTAVEHGITEPILVHIRPLCFEGGISAEGHEAAPQPPRRRRIGRGGAGGLDLGEGGRATPGEGQQGEGEGGERSEQQLGHINTSHLGERPQLTVAHHEITWAHHV